MPLPPLRVTNSLSFAATKIFPARRQPDGSFQEGAIATGFLWRRDGVFSLVTNWHNVTGWDPVNGKAISKNCLTPDVLKLNLAFRKSAKGRDMLGWSPVLVELFDAEGSPRWLEHPQHGHRVDVVVLELGPLGIDVWNEAVNTYADFFDFEPAAGDDAFVLGYPKGLDGGASLPLWKRASIASEPFAELDGLPKLLIDTATRPGMSGSPVIAVRRGLIRPRGQDGPEPTPETVIGTAETFLGIYSGRVDDDPLGAQLGIVWKGRVVEEILNGGVRGRTPFD